MLRRSAISAGLAVSLFLLTGCEAFNKKAETAPADQTAKTETKKADEKPLLLPTPATTPERVEPAQTAQASPAEPAKPIAGEQQPLPKESYAPTAAPSSRVHVVQPKETLRSLAKKYYNDPNKWRHIYEANRQKISDPGQIRAGMKLIIP